MSARLAATSATAGRLERQRRQEGAHRDAPGEQNATRARVVLAMRERDDEQRDRRRDADVNQQIVRRVDCTYLRLEALHRAICRQIWLAGIPKQKRARAFSLFWKGQFYPRHWRPSF